MFSKNVNLSLSQNEMLITLFKQNLTSYLFISCMDLIIEDSIKVKLLINFLNMFLCVRGKTRSY